jgi:DNA-binding XRE family transcriptional regulator
MHAPHERQSVDGEERVMTGFPTVVSDGHVTHVIVPVEEYNRLCEESRAGAAPPSPTCGFSGREIDEAIATLASPETQWHDAEDVVLDILRDGIAPVRKRLGLTQEQLATRIGLSQSRVSRLEGASEDVTIAVLRRIATVVADEASAQVPTHQTRG